MSAKNGNRRVVHNLEELLNILNRRPNATEHLKVNARFWLGVSKYDSEICTYGGIIVITRNPECDGASGAWHSIYRFDKHIPDFSAQFYTANKWIHVPSYRYAAGPSDYIKTQVFLDSYNKSLKAEARLLGLRSKHRH